MTKKIFIISTLILLIDQIVKLLIELSITKPIIIIKDFFNITRVYNIGAAWSILQGKQPFLIIIGLSSLYLIYTIFIKNKKLTNLEQIVYSLLLGGILGNLCDRLIRGKVVDYLDFNIFNYDFPVFNLADICIVTSITLLLLMTIKEEVNGKNNG